MAVLWQGAPSTAKTCPCPYARHSPRKRAPSCNGFPREPFARRYGLLRLSRRSSRGIVSRPSAARRVRVRVRRGTGGHGDKKVKKKDKAFDDPVKWAATRWAQTQRQLGIFKSDEAIGYPDIAEAAASILNRMYSLCQTYMNNRSYDLEHEVSSPADMFVGDYCDCGATLFCLALQQAWAEETQITDGYEVGDERAQERWTLANLHGTLQKGYKGEKFALEEGNEADQA